MGTYWRKNMYITITDSNGIVLDRFQVARWNEFEPDGEIDDDIEGFGSPASNAMLLERILNTLE